MTGYAYQDVKQTIEADFAGQPDFNGTVIDVWLEFDYSEDILLNIFNFNALCYFQNNCSRTSSTTMAGSIQVILHVQR